MSKKSKNENPFLGEMEPLILRKKMVVQQKTYRGKFGVEEELRKVRVYTTDVQEFTMLYKIPNVIGLLNEMSTMTCKVFLYVLFTVEKDYVIIKRNEIARELNVSLRSISLAITSMVELGLLRKKSRFEYWINPMVFFTGNRKDYVCKSETGKYKVIRDKTPEIEEYEED